MRTEKQFASDLVERGYGVFLERTESNLETWTVKLPESVGEFQLNGVRLEREVANELAFLAYLAERPTGNVVWVSFTIPARDRSQYTVKSMYPKHPGLDHACVQVFEMSLKD